MVLLINFSPRPAALRPASAPASLKLLYILTPQQVIPPEFFRRQPPFFYQLSYPHRTHPEDLSGIFRCDQIHLTQSSKPR